MAFAWTNVHSWGLNRAPLYFIYAPNEAMFRVVERRRSPSVYTGLALELDPKSVLSVVEEPSTWTWTKTPTMIRCTEPLHFIHALVSVRRKPSIETALSTYEWLGRLVAAAKTLQRRVWPYFNVTTVCFYCIYEGEGWIHLGGTRARMVVHLMVYT